MIRRQLPGGGGGGGGGGPGPDGPGGPGGPGSQPPGGGGDQGAGGCPSVRRRSLAKRTPRELTRIIGGHNQEAGRRDQQDVRSAKISFKLQKAAEVQGGCSGASFQNQQSLLQLQQKVHEGDKGTLNVLYIQNPPGVGIKGLCNIVSAGQSELGKRDGCAVAMDTLPGQGGQDLAKVTTHELGHAMGLDHPFSQGDAAGGLVVAPGGPPGGGGGGGGQCQDNDGIEDTPPQQSPMKGCPNGGGGGKGGVASLFSMIHRQMPGGGGGPGGGGQGGGGSCPAGANANNIMDYS